MNARSYREYGGRRTAAILAGVGLSSLSFVLIAACATSDTRTEPEPDERVVIPEADASLDAAVDAPADGEVPAAPCAAGSLCSAPSPLTIGFVTAIRGRSTSDVWASGTGGLLMHWNGQTWTALDSGINDTLDSLFVAADETWGISGTLVLRRSLDPESVRTMRAPSRPLSSLAVLPGGMAYVSVIGPHNAPPVARPLATLDFDTRVLTYPPGPVLPWSNQSPELALRASVLVPDGALWLVGDRGTVVRYPLLVPDAGGASPQDAGSMAGPSLGQGTVFPAPTLRDLLAVWGTEEQLWAVGRGGTIVHFDGAQWHTPESGTTETLNAVFGLSPSDVWAAGDDGTALHFDGTTWSAVDVGTYRGSLRAIWAATSDDVWLGGEGGLFHWGALP